MPRANAVGLSVSHATRDTARRLAGQLTADTGDRISMDAAILIALQVALADIPAARAIHDSASQAESRADAEGPAHE